MRCSLLFLSASLLMLASCGGSKSSPAVADAVADDTTTVIDDLPIPEAADELFDDFIFNFAANRKLQMERTRFPLTVTDGAHTRKVARSEWQMEHFFMRQGYYTLLFDSEQHMEVVKDTTVSHAVVEKIFFDRQAVCRYVFDRSNGAWMLTRIQTVPFSEVHNPTFLAFYHQFATDKEFQQRHLAKTVSFVGPDPDDDFSQMEGIITADTWEAFAPKLPSQMIYNIVYGQPSREGNQMVFVMRGIANGLELEMVFRRSGNVWRLTKLTT